MAHTNEERVIALGALLQCCLAVDAVARGKGLKTEKTQPLLDSLFIFDAENTESIYGNLNNIKPGLFHLRELLKSGNTQEASDVARYAMSIIALEGNLSKHSEMLTIMRNRLQHIETQRTFFQDDPEKLYHSIAGLYKDTISQLRFQIQVKGEIKRLQQPQNADQIRSYLLCAMRAAILWRQVGGKRWHLLLNRQSLLRTVERLL